jgi:hypothetical protein
MADNENRDAVTIEIPGDMKQYYADSYMVAKLEKDFRIIFINLKLESLDSKGRVNYESVPLFEVIIPHSIAKGLYQGIKEQIEDDDD